MSSSKPSLVELTIERPVAGGRMLARLEGRVVFVAGTLPGERVRARITRRSGGVAFAETQEIIEASPDRREPVTDPRCGGDLYGHIRYDRQVQLKAEVIADTFRRIAKQTLDADVRVTRSPEHGYRLRSRFHVRGTQLGFLLEGTHELCDAEATRQLSAEAFAAIGRLRDGLGEGLKACAAVTLAEGVAPRERVALCELRPEADPAQFAGLPLPEGLTGVAVQTPRGTFTAAGTDRIVDTARDVLESDADLQWVRQSGSFFQGNRFLVGALTRRVLELAAGRTFADLYSGVGLFAVALASRGAEGLAVEGDPVSGHDLSVNAAQTGGRLSVRLAPVERAVTKPPVPRLEVVVVDPPRTGLSREVVKGLIAWASPRIVYVSCDVPTLARDTAAFIGSGYRLTSLDGVDMFPNTPHVECVAVFDR